MAYPATININYYQGDTYEFILYPLDKDGGAFPLSGWDSSFKIAKRRGSSNISDYIGEGSSTVSTGDSSITCEISALQGSSLSPDTVYVYDVAINDGTKEYTLVTGSITVTAQVKEVLP